MRCLLPCALTRGRFCARSIGEPRVCDAARRALQRRRHGALPPAPPPTLPYRSPYRSPYCIALLRGVLCKLNRTVSRPRGAVQVWVVDTELLMVPAFVGARCRSANVGFVFNTPFPSSVRPTPSSYLLPCMHVPLPLRGISYASSSESYDLHTTKSHETRLERNHPLTPHARAAQDIFRMLPARKEILSSLLNSDMIMSVFE